MVVALAIVAAIGDVGRAPRALLFAARSPMRERKIDQIPQETLSADGRWRA